MSERVIRLFVSSPSDVSTERRRAALVVEQLNGEFAGRVRIQPVLWEEHFYSSHAGFQDQIAEAATFDIVIGTGAKLGVKRQERLAGMSHWPDGISVRLRIRAYHCRPHTEPEAVGRRRTVTSAFADFCSSGGSPGNWLSLQ